MSTNLNNKPDFLFEISWEICNKVGGIYTVLSTKSEILHNTFGDNQIYIGPDVWMETTNTPDFEADNELLKSWAAKAKSDGLQFRIGHWKVHGNPIVILVDFKQYFKEKNRIFTEYWEKYKLDSISGQWDYIEPVMFGYAAAKIIESFYEFNISASDTIAAQFHEWMSGMGILYLKEKLPQIATIFTTHATMVGRCAAGNGIQLYKYLDKINAAEIANKYNINAKYSIENLSIKLCDVFTTVSEITSNESKAFYKREADVITPNGFNRELSPSIDSCDEKRRKARKLIFSVANAMFNQTFSEDTPILLSSGRYEFHNKGLDMFIDALGKINKETDKDVIAFISVPANSISPVKQLQDILTGENKEEVVNEKFLTHYIYSPEYDSILNTCKNNALTNDNNCRVKVIFVPVYLNGNDGLFNVSYYDLLPAADLSVFASYYEPWGYTPLESIAFAVPTITTNLSGFGRWVEKIDPDKRNGVKILQRNDDNYLDAVNNLCKYIIDYIHYDKKTRETCRRQAFTFSDNFLWNNLISNYFDAYDLALQISLSREELYKDKMFDVDLLQSTMPTYDSPIWRKLFVKQVMPDTLKSLKKLSMNLWWSWNPCAENLFKSINPQRWEELQHNPISLLESLSIEEIKGLEDDVDFNIKLGEATKEFDTYMSVVHNDTEPSIAYFSMEYGIHNTLKIFSGGLGMLAGDYLKEMSDCNVNITGIGLLYRYGYFKQTLSPEGDQISTTSPQKFTHLPIKPMRDANGEWIKIKIAFPARNLTAKVWRVDVGRIPLYLMDTDIEDNIAADRAVTHHLYGGDNENRLKQELLLGVGGIRLLRQLHLTPTIYHLNEGHAAFAGLERLREYVQEQKFLKGEALEIVRSSTLFTTHTPVPAGHDSFSEDLLRTYIPHYPDRIGCMWEQMINMGKFKPNSDEKFSMSVLAISTAQEVNGVSRIHGRVTRDMFVDLYKGYYSNELYMDYVTNGVHYPSWVAEKWRDLHTKVFGDNFLHDQSNPQHWEKIYDVDDKTIWEIKNDLRKTLIDTLKERLDNEMTTRNESPKAIIKVKEELNKDKLTIGFARRFATYKRAHLLFQNLDRLSAIVNSEKYPVQFIFAGKAHPADKAGQDLIKKIIEISRRPEFTGKIVFVENYDMELAKKLVQGVDIWMNTPTRPLEASGTSGEKAAMNGVLNFSVLDGWWAEGYKEGAGWALKEERTYQNQYYQDILDSETIYYMFENDIVPKFYKRDEANIPFEWVQYIKNNFAHIAPHFTMKRMVDDYINKFYNKLSDRTKKISANDFKLAKRYANWKQTIINSWANIEIKAINVPDANIKTYKVGEIFEMSVVLKMNGLSPEDVAIDVIFGRKEGDMYTAYKSRYEMKVSHKIGSTVEYTMKEAIKVPGIVDIAIRVRPNNELMPYPQDLKLVKWI